VESDEDVRIRFYIASELLLDETYTPDFNNRITVDFKDIIINYLWFTIPTSNLFMQPDIVKEFTIEVNELNTIEFYVLRAGVAKLALSPEIFTLKNFLTWQPRMKNTTASQPEWLTHYAGFESADPPPLRFMYAKAYFADGTRQNVRIGELTTDFAITVNINAIIKSFETLPVKLETAIFKTDSPEGELLSKYQYYNIISEEPDEQYFLFENSLGGIDSVRCTGALKRHPEFTRETALMGNTERTFFTEKKDIRKQNTGWITKYVSVAVCLQFVNYHLFLLYINNLIISGSNFVRIKFFMRALTYSSMPSSSSVDSIVSSLFIHFCK
jgi:hypothetical protein